MAAALGYFVSPMKRRRSVKHIPDRIPLQPITDFAREVGDPLPPPVASYSPLSVPQVSLPAQRDQLARSSASPKSAVLPASRMIPAADKERRSRRRRARRTKQRTRRRLITAIFCLVLAAVFSAGFLWKVIAAKRAEAVANAPVPVNAERRAEALRLMDDAVRAKYEERTGDALASAAAAREADPNIPGVDVLVGELALVSKQPDTVKHAAGEALRRGQGVAGAKLLLALHKWITRGQLRTPAEAGDAAAQLLSEASDAELSNMATMFFWGDIERYAGREHLAHDRLLGAMHRQQPWLSWATIAAKMQLAANEAGDMSDHPAPHTAPVPSTRAGNALVALRRAATSGADPQPALAALRSAATAWQASLLLSDQAFDRPGAPPQIAAAKNAAAANIPGGGIAPPETGAQ